MELRKQQEVEHYDRLALEWRARVALRPELTSRLDIEAIEVMKMSSYQFLYELLKRYIPGKKVLDYGCGHGLHTLQLAKIGAGEVMAIDLSEESLKIAEERIRQEKLEARIKFIKADAEALELPNNSFDIVFDGGTFSSIELEKGLQEIYRVLKPGGLLIGIETLGHHPIANLKRWLNKKRGIRTSWAATHIMKMNDFNLAKRYFRLKELRFFHFTSLLIIPLQSFPGGNLILRLTETLDKFLFKSFPSLRKYAFKAVFVLRKV